ncbi:MAG TPA: hypothetical protein EYO33_23130 [Phycisphaerales bacterium]|nr:hypothetical protein [Phycisphaerales bacterium]
MLIQNININIAQAPAFGPAPRPFSQESHRQGTSFDQININFRQPTYLKDKLSVHLPEIDGKKCRSSCRSKAAFGRGRMARLMWKMSRLLGQQQGIQPARLCQAAPTRRSFGPSECGGQVPSASPCPSPQQNQTQLLRQMLHMLFNLAQTLDGANQNFPACPQGRGGIPAGHFAAPAPAGQEPSGKGCGRPSPACHSKPNTTEKCEKIGVRSGRGDDNIRLKNVKNAVVKSGRGDDKIRLKNVKNAVVKSGRGDDKIVFQPGEKTRSALLDGGKGCDTAVIGGDSPLSLSDKDGNVFFKRGKGGPTITVDDIERIKLKGDDAKITLFPNAFQ